VLVTGCEWDQSLSSRRNKYKVLWPKSLLETRLRNDWAWKPGQFFSRESQGKWKWKLHCCRPQETDLSDNVRKTVLSKGSVINCTITKPVKTTYIWKTLPYFYKVQSTKLYYITNHSADEITQPCVAWKPESKSSAVLWLGRWICSSATAAYPYESPPILPAPFMPRQAQTREQMNNYFLIIVLECFFGSKEKSAAEEGGGGGSSCEGTKKETFSTFFYPYILHIRIFGSLVSNTAG